MCAVFFLAGVCLGAWTPKLSPTEKVPKMHVPFLIQAKGVVHSDRQNLCRMMMQNPSENYTKDLVGWTPPNVFRVGAETIAELVPFVAEICICIRNNSE